MKSTFFRQVEILIGFRRVTIRTLVTKVVETVVAVTGTWIMVAILIRNQEGEATLQPNQEFCFLKMKAKHINICLIIL